MTSPEGAAARGLSRVVHIADTPDHGRHVDIEADPAARRILAERLGVPALDALRGEFDIAKTPEGAAVAGRIMARLQRDCVISLERFTETIDETFDIRYSRAAARESAGAEVEIDLDGPEPLAGDAIDLGEILTSQLALAMDPYPRKPGAKPLAEEFGGETKISPFSGLRRAFAKPGDTD
jgi:hypothetical protein